MNNIIIIDIDGVILKCDEWFCIEEFYKKLDTCKPIYWTINILKTLLITLEATPVFLTARNEKYKNKTISQLDQYFDIPYKLYMRKQNDLREDPEIKEDYIKQLIKDNNILFCIDDNIKNCSMYRKYKLNVLHVYEPFD